MPGFLIQSEDPNTSISNKALYHRSHRWIIEELGKPLSLPQNQTITRARVSALKSPPERLHAQSVQLPSLTFDEEKIISGSSIEYKIAKKAEWQDIVVKFYDVYGIYEYYEEWQQLIWSDQSGIGRPDNYKGEFKVYQTDSTGERVITYTAHGAYPKSITHGDLTYTSSEVKLLTVTYSYDYAKIVHS